MSQENETSVRSKFAGLANLSGQDEDEKQLLADMAHRKKNRIWSLNEQVSCNNRLGALLGDSQQV